MTEPTQSHAASGREPMSDDFFGSIYVECEQTGDQIGWLDGEGINRRAWISFMDFVQSELRDGLANGTLEPEVALDGAIASAMQVAWIAAKRQALGEPEVCDHHWIDEPQTVCAHCGAFQ